MASDCVLVAMEMYLYIFVLIKCILIASLRASGTRDEGGGFEVTLRAYKLFLSGHDTTRLNVKSTDTQKKKRNRTIRNRISWTKWISFSRM